MRLRNGLTTNESDCYKGGQPVAFVKYGVQVRNHASLQRSIGKTAAFTNSLSFGDAVAGGLL